MHVEEKEDGEEGSGEQELAILEDDEVAVEIDLEREKKKVDNQRITSRSKVLNKDLQIVQSLDTKKHKIETPKNQQDQVKKTLKRTETAPNQTKKRTEPVQNQDLSLQDDTLSKRLSHPVLGLNRLKQSKEEPAKTIQ